MNDLDIAKCRLNEKKLSLVFVKNLEVIFETDKEGLSGFLRAIGKLNKELSAASVADKTIGKAAALLCAYSQVKAAYAVNMSKSGRRTLEEHKISRDYQFLVPAVLNRKRVDKCPYEKLVETIDDPKEAYEKLKLTCEL